ncbi:up-regulated during skeletal muscle growth protein 5 [Camponotus floridanus]|uniref:up-regulated during skeletal muscle growth protein 5 n=1 Tax=Camponotus floridanus TaxID=104421 RepID=UPI0009716AE9|nr:up-regulated during skeletal muscle growth protein 5 [Camponotus floridanus]
MAEGEEKLTGLAKHFNSQTMYGRANVSKATYLAIGTIALFFYLKPKSKKT